MTGVAVWAVIGGIALALAPRAAAQPAAAVTQTGKLPGPRAVLDADNPAGGLADLPPLPPAKDSTIFGGAIRRIDPVRDQFMLDVYGQHPMKVLFDERTQLYRDGVRIPVHDLGPVRHASVQTALDGDRIYALSIHILSSLPQGDYRGRVLKYNWNTGELELDAYPSPRPFTVLVPGTASIVREGQAEFTSEESGRADLRRGAIVDVTFASSAGVPGVASRVVVLAVPGSSFIFTGDITELNIATGSLVLVDPRDQRSYQISFIPSEFSVAGSLRIGERIRLTATYDGTSYTATDITPY